MSKNHKHKSNGKLEVTENPNYVAPEETTYDIPRGWPKYPVFPDSGDVPGPPIQFEEMTPDSVRAGYTFTDPNMIGEVDEYFYHGDHISSVTLVTDKRATIVQSFAYMPYGELLVEESSVDLAYRFSAKETDRETGLSYFGARYYDPTAAMWLGTDPLWEKYVGMNPYNYCAGNPVGLVDVDGRTFTEAAEKMVQRMEAYADEGIAKRQKELERQGDCDSKKCNRLREEIRRFQDAKKEIAEMRASDQIYDYRTYFKKPKKTESGGVINERHYNGYVSCDQDTKVFIININKYYADYNGEVNLGDFAHELKHGYQFETGRLSLKGNKNGGIIDIGGHLYDYTDELEAHLRGSVFGSSAPAMPDMKTYENRKQGNYFVNPTYLHFVETRDDYRYEIFRNTLRK